jgi:hypothetical protein
MVTVQPAALKALAARNCSASSLGIARERGTVFLPGLIQA